MVKPFNKCKTKTTKNNIVKIFHQNIRGLRNKYNEILCHLQEYSPQVICFTEHHLGRDEIVHIKLTNYTLGAYYSRNNFNNGGTYIYVHDSLTTHTINLDKFFCDKDIEACAVTLNTINFKVIILTIYRSPSSDYEIFLSKLGFYKISI